MLNGDEKETHTYMHAHTHTYTHTHTQGVPNKAWAVQMLLVALSLLMCCSLVCIAILSAGLPRESMETPMIRPGILRELRYSSRISNDKMSMILLLTKIIRSWCVCVEGRVRVKVSMIVIVRIGVREKIRMRVRISGRARVRVSVNVKARVLACVRNKGKSMRGCDNMTVAWGTH